jgi:Putative MetA-pathway of phenol degradation
MPSSVVSCGPRFPPFLASISGVLLILPPAQAQTSTEITTDRPDFVESTRTVGAGRVQVETSVAVSDQREGTLAITTWTTPTLIRVGVTEVLELRLESDWLVRAETTPDIGTTTTTSDVADLSVGVKWHLMGQSRGIPAMALLVHADMPTASADRSQGGTRPSLRVSGEWGMGSGLGIGIMPGILYDRDGQDRFLSGILGVVVGKGWTPKLGSFVELALEQIAATRHGGTVGAVGIGATYLVSPFWQLDTALSLGLNDRSTDVGFTVGLSGVVLR